MKDSTETTTTLANQSVDERIRRQVQAFLRTSHYLPLRALSCDVDNGVLTVRGRVPTFYLKQLAFAELMRKLSICEINDLIEVTLPSEAMRTKEASSKEVLRLGRSRRGR